MARACFLWLREIVIFLVSVFSKRSKLIYIIQMILQSSRFSLVQYSRNRHGEETEFILYRRDQRRNGLNYARPCWECVDNIMRIFFPHECRRDADGQNEWIYNGDERFPRTSTRSRCVIFILRDTPLVTQDGKSRSNRTDYGLSLSPPLS